jgi:hypothetical protein
MDPHKNERQDPDPHQSDKLDLDPDPHQSDKLGPDPEPLHFATSQNVGNGI